MPVTRQTQDQVYGQIIAEFKEINKELGSLRVEMKTLKDNIEPINKIIRGDGNVLSISTQVELVKQELGHVSKTVTKSETKLKDLEDRNDTQIKDLEAKVDKFNVEDRKGKWILITAITSGILGLISAAITAIITLTK